MKWRARVRDKKTGDRRTQPRCARCSADKAATRAIRRRDDHAPSPGTPTTTSPARSRPKGASVAGLHRDWRSGLELLAHALDAGRLRGVTLKAYHALDIRSSRAVSAEGDLDFRGTLGVAKDAPVGFAQIRLTFDVDTDAPQEKLDQLLKLTERYCVVYQTIKSGPPVEVKLRRT